MMWLWNACLTWFGNLPVKMKLYISFGWMCLFTVCLGAVCLGGIYQLRQATEAAATAPASPPTAQDAGLQVKTTSSAQSIEAIATSYFTVILSLMGGILAINLLMAWRLTHLICDPIVRASEALNRVSRRDLTAAAIVESTDEVGQMCLALNDVISHFHTVLQEIGRSAQSLESVAGALGEETHQTSVNCTQQKELAQQVLAATRLLSEKGSQIAQNSEQTAGASRESAQAAESGSTVMASAAETMGQVAASSTTISDLMGKLDSRSHEISKVVTTIREISENTNLLALNAAIEAARAGEQGRGFAVVAGEVRRLAEHTRTATEEIASMVESIQHETASTTQAVETSRNSIEEGQRRTSAAHQMLSAIIEHATQAEQLAGGTAHAAEDQSAAGQQIANNAAQVADLAAASLAASAQAAASGKAIQDSARRLRQVVGQFTF